MGASGEQATAHQLRTLRAFSCDAIMICREVGGPEPKLQRCRQLAVKTCTKRGPATGADTFDLLASVSARPREGRPIMCPFPIAMGLCEPGRAVQPAHRNLAEWLPVRI